MHPKSPKWLEDLIRYCLVIERAMAGRTQEHLQSDLMLRLAVERAFEIVAECVLRLERTDLPTVERLTDYRQIIGFRNRVAHGYDDEIDLAKMWAVIIGSLQTLRREAETIYAEVAGEEG
jgi:uncharacterized protein with HEPN domain